MSHLKLAAWADSKRIWQLSLHKEPDLIPHDLLKLLWAKLKQENSEHEILNVLFVTINRYIPTYVLLPIMILILITNDHNQSTVLIIQNSII